MAYTPSYEKPYADGFKNKPNETTPITADVMNGYDNAIVSIETYLAEGGGGSASIAYGDEDAFNEWSEVATDGEMFVRTDDNDSDGVIYSTEEKKWGTWVDGKTIYKKTYLYNGSVTGSANSWTKTNISGSFVETLINGEFVSPTQKAMSSMNWAITDGYFAFHTYRAFAISSGMYLTFYYTKNTD